MEDELNTFDAWLRYQTGHVGSLTSEQLKMWRSTHDEIVVSAASTPEVGLMKLVQASGEHSYVIAIREGTDHWLTLSECPLSTQNEPSLPWGTTT